MDIVIPIQLTSRQIDVINKALMESNKEINLYFLCSNNQYLKVTGRAKPTPKPKAK